MKIKKDADRSLVDFVFGQLERIPALRFRRMFGAYGIYSGDTFFAIVNDGLLFFKTSEDTRQPYLTAGMEPLKDSNGEVILKNYYQVPVDVIEDADTLEDWARTALTLPQTASSKRRTSKPSGKAKK